MIDIVELVNKYCIDNDLQINLSFNMPKGYENANAMYDNKIKTIFMNLNVIGKLKDYEQCFYLYHELRHASQYNKPNDFNTLLIKSLDYVIMYNGICYKMVDETYKMTHIDGDEEYFLNAYLSQPYEIDANRYAYEVTKSKYGYINELDELLNFYIPKKELSDQELDEIYKIIDNKVNSLI